jgi:hypothetical protein
MNLLLTILSVLALWALLAVLIVGLLLILKPLESVRTSLQKIGMGVRAIDQQTRPLGGYVVMLVGTLEGAAEGLSEVSGQLSNVEEDLKKAGPVLLRGD